MRISKGASFAGGVVFAVVISGGTAVATNGGSFVLGSGNAATATTGLANAKGTPLSLVAKKGTPPLRVSNTVKVKNLDSDLLDGKDSTAFLGKSARAADSAKLGGQPASGYLGTTGTAADSAKLGGQSAASYLSTTGTAADSAKLGGQPAANYVATTYYASTNVDGTPALAPKLDDSLIDAIALPAGTYLVTFSGDFANTAAVNGDFGCELIFGAPLASAAYGMFANVSLNPGGSGSSATYASGTVSQVVTLAAAKQVSAECYVNTGDSSHTSYLYNSTLTAVRVQSLQGVATPFSSAPLGRHARQR